MSERKSPMGDEHRPGRWWLWPAFISLFLWGAIIGAGYLIVDLIR